MAAEIFCFFKCGKGGEFRVEYGGLYFSISSEHWVSRFFQSQKNSLGSLFHTEHARLYLANTIFELWEQEYVLVVLSHW